MILPLTAALALLGPHAAAAETGFCRAAEAAAARSDFSALPASLADAMSCGVNGGEPSNYVLATDADAPAEVHIIAVEGGPGSLLQEGGAPSRGQVKVAVHATRKPVILALVSASAVRWDLKLTPESRLSEIVLLGDARSDLKGAPADIPVLRRDPGQACGLARAWEGAGKRFRRMVGGLRCLTGLRETSFQGCARGFLFEIPHYRQDSSAYAKGVPRFACPRLPVAAGPPVPAPALEWAAPEPRRRTQK